GVERETNLPVLGIRDLDWCRLVLNHAAVGRPDHGGVLPRDLTLIEGSQGPGSLSLSLPLQEPLRGSLVFALFGRGPKGFERQLQRVCPEDSLVLFVDRLELGRLLVTAQRERRFARDPFTNPGA